MPLYVKTSDVSRLEGCSSTTASRLLNQVRYALGKSAKKPITISEYCEYFEVDQEEVTKYLHSAIAS